VGYSHIIKWLPSSLRTRNPGPLDCLDIQLDTVSGKRDVRLQCQSPAHVEALIGELKDVVRVSWGERGGGGARAGREGMIVEVGPGPPPGLLAGLGRAASCRGCRGGCWAAAVAPASLAAVRGR
jgi:hypothetical protein